MRICHAAKPDGFWTVLTPDHFKLGLKGIGVAGTPGTLNLSPTVHHQTLLVSPRGQDHNVPWLQMVLEAVVIHRREANNKTIL